MYWLSSYHVTVVTLRRERLARVLNAQYRTFSSSHVTYM